MKILQIFDKINKNLFINLILLFIFIFQVNLQFCFALDMDNQNVIEELRLEVPSNFKDVWIKAEKEIWEPWLDTKNGYLGRQIFWNKDNEEALILVKWKNKDLWKNIPIEEVENIQKRFEKNVKLSLKTNTNPFKLIQEGELYKQG